MKEYTSVQYHGPEAQGNLRWTAENEGIYDSDIGSKFPEKQKAQQDKNAGYTDNSSVSELLVQIMMLTSGKFTHCCSAPSISG